MPFLHKLGLANPVHRAWAMYDWANSAFVTVCITAVFPIYFSKVVAAGHDNPAGIFSLATTIALAFAAFLGPLLGALVDVRPWKKRLTAVATLLGSLSCFGLAFAGPGDVTLALVCFGLGNIALYSAFVGYDGLLPHIARADEVDRLSLAGYAFGYLGGGLLLAFAVALVLAPTTFGLADTAAASRLAFAAVGVWWLLFSLPLIRRVPEPSVAATARPAGQGALSGAWTSLSHTLHELRRFRQAWLLLIAFLIYNDGVGTIFRMATTFGTELGIPTSAQVTAILLVQFIGLPAAFAYGALGARFGTKPMILVGLCVYGLITLLATVMSSALHFYLLAVLVGLVQGGVQALSRSLFARMIPAARSGEFFGFFGVFEKFAGVFGPALTTIFISFTGSSRSAIWSILVFFIVGGLLLTRVDVAAGEAAAQAANRAGE